MAFVAAHSCMKFIRSCTTCSPALWPRLVRRPSPRVSVVLGVHVCYLSSVRKNETSPKFGARTGHSAPTHVWLLLHRPKCNCTWSCTANNCILLAATHPLHSRHGVCVCVCVALAWRKCGRFDIAYDRVARRREPRYSLRAPFIPILIVPVYLISLQVFHLALNLHGL